MSQTRLLYIEQKTGHQHNGPAWIARVRVSRSGSTVYFNGKALKRSGGQGIEGNHYDLETGDEYWVSGVKKDGKDRHWTGLGKVRVDAASLDDYLAHLGREELDPTQFEICHDIVENDIERLHDIENEGTP